MTTLPRDFQIKGDVVAGVCKLITFFTVKSHKNPAHLPQISLGVPLGAAWG